MRTFGDTSQAKPERPRRVASSAPALPPIKAVAAEPASVCPKCGSSRIATASSVLEGVRGKKANRALDGELVRVVHRTTVRRCRDCGHTEAEGAERKARDVVGYVDSPDDGGLGGLF